MANERTKDDIIRSLASALNDQLQWAYVDSQPGEKPKSPPFKVPYAIQSDLAKFTEAKDRAEAYKLIKQAVAEAAGLKPGDF